MGNASRMANRHPQPVSVINRFRQILSTYEPLIRDARKKVKDGAGKDASIEFRQMFEAGVREDLRQCIGKNKKLSVPCFENKINEYVDNALKTLDRFAKQKSTHNAESILISYTLLRAIKNILSL